MTIHLLADELISQIAAGEVVERPASVVKELIENALDAGASSITIRIEDGGIHLIEVSDDGVGIPNEEIAMALRRHATSKLQDAEGLFHIQTLGFRGEALASMASVSRLTMTSRPKDQSVGGQMFVDGGKTGELKKLGVPEGTVIRVENLFYNVPARKAFLKKPVTEKGRINALVNRYALAYPNVRWQLFQDHKPVLRTSGNGDRREILAAMYGVAISRDLIEVNLEDDDLHVFGYISPLEVTRSQRKEITFFVNGRWIQNTGLSSALLSAYQNMLPPRRYPIAAIFVEMNPEQVDVNVHPAKAEVRFKDSQRIYSGVQRAVKRAFLAFTPIDPRSESGFDQPSGSPWRQQTQSGWRGRGNPEKDPAWMLAGMMQDEEQTAFGSLQDFSENEKQQLQSSFVSEEVSLFRLIGGFKEHYLLAEAPDGLYLIDENAAMERILFETFLRVAGETGISNIDVGESMIAAAEKTIDDWVAAYEKLGFHLESFGPKEFRLNTIPSFFEPFTPVLPDIFTAMLQLDFPKKLISDEEKTEWLLIALVKITGKTYSSQGNREEQQRLLSRLQVCKNPRYCPDGRATLIHLSMDALDQQFRSS